MLLTLADPTRVPCAGRLERDALSITTQCDASQLVGGRLKVVEVVYVTPAGTLTTAPVEPQFEAAVLIFVCKSLGLPAVTVNEFALGWLGMVVLILVAGSNAGPSTLPGVTIMSAS
jgi:hypothetical protein